MVGVDKDRECVVTFLPDGRVAVVPWGTTILEAARAAGIDLDAVCGGEGKCGRCKVRPDGDFEAEPSAVLSEEERAGGVTLACTTRVKGVVLVEVLPRSRIRKHQILTRSVSEIPRPVTPWVRKEFYQVPHATVWDNVADLERLWRVLGKSSLPMPLEALRELPDALRKSGWKVTITLSRVDSTDEITMVEPDDTTDRLLGVAVDIGTTTVVVDLVDLVTGEVLGTASEYNRQISRGEDVISRMIYSEEGGGEELTALVRTTINDLIAKLVSEEAERFRGSLRPQDIAAAAVAGNTIMSHFFAGLPTKHLRMEPYVPVAHHAGYLKAGELGLAIRPSARVLLFPSRAGYVGGDVIADVVASGMHRSGRVSLLIDVGTNGEIVLGKKDWLVACACSAGPAFEGGEVSCGMRAMEGAIEKLRIDDDLSTTYRVIGGGRPSGICGSGLIDLVAEMYARGVIDRKARIQDIRSERIRFTDEGREYVIEWKDALAANAPGDLVITDADLQNLLRTKAAVYGACSTLMRKMGEKLEDVASIIIAGGFGYHLDVGRAISIGMFPDVPMERYRFIGNGALGGARLALLSERHRKEMVEVFDMMTYIELSVDDDFYSEFSSALFIPHTDLGRFPSALPQHPSREGRT